MKGPGRYPGYDVLAKRDSPSWDAITRRVVDRRIGEPPPRRFFDEAEWRTLEALCATVMPQPDRETPIPLAPWVDAAMVENRTSGTRYATMPTMREAWRRGLAALDAEARAQTGQGFAGLPEPRRAQLLKSVDDEEVQSDAWVGLSPRQTFRKVLAAEIVRVYYAHPEAWNEIGFGGPASPRGYVRIGAGRRDSWEAPRPEEDR